MTRTRLLAAVLLALALRSLIPVGFMPAADGSLSLIMCHDGFPPALLAGHASRGGHGIRDNDHCGFCTGFSAAPPTQLPAALFLLLAGFAAVAVAAAAPARIRLVHLPQARAPPALL
jgi:hypothetical protein